MELELRGKVAAVTGGSVGIGLAVAEGLAKEGVDVALCARDADRVRDRAAEIAQAYGVRAIGVQADVSKAADCQRFADEIDAAFGGLDILINNAGTGSDEKIMDAPDDKWQYYWELHVMAAVRLSKLLAPKMQARGGGVILHNASICATQPSFYEPIYNTTKAALVMFSKCLANELIPSNIRVNTINAGLIDTPDWHKTAALLTRGTSQTPDDYLLQIAKDLTPIGRFATPAELADFFVFLCSPRASYSVGSSYYVDGGWLKTVN